MQIIERYLRRKGSSTSIVVPSPGSPTRPLVMFSGTAQRWMNSWTGQMLRLSNIFGYFFTWVNQHMESFLGILALEDDFEGIFAPRRNGADYQHDPPLVSTKVSRKLHLQRKNDVVQSKLRSQRDWIFRICQVDESCFFGRKGNLLTSRCCTRVESWR